MSKYYFPEEIIREILLRLSHVKSHVRFTCVNKSWRSMIKSPSFVSAHVAHANGSDNNNNSGRLLLLKLSGTEEANWSFDGSSTAIFTACLGEQVTEEDKHKSKSFIEYAELRFPCKGLSYSFEVVGSCNGLVLLRRYTNTIILWNPSIRKFVSLPKPALGCRHASTGWGFGFDSLENDYKVVKIVSNVEIDGDRKVDSHVQVFSLNSGSWKTIGAVGVPACRFLEFDYHRGAQAYINGVIHWLTLARIDIDVLQNIVLSFDVSNEIFREIKLPNEIACAFPPLLSISVYGKMLAVCVVGVSFHSMWVMTECKSWTQLLTFDTIINIPKPLGFTKAGEVLWERDGGELASYDPKSQKMVNHNVNGGQWGFCFADSYVETLVLLNEATEQTMQQGRVNNSRGK